MQVNTQGQQWAKHILQVELCRQHQYREVREFRSKQPLKGRQEVLSCETAIHSSIIDLVTDLLNLAILSISCDCEELAVARTHCCCELSEHCQS